MNLICKIKKINGIKPSGLNEKIYDQTRDERIDTLKRFEKVRNKDKCIPREGENVKNEAK